MNELKPIAYIVRTSRLDPGKLAMREGDPFLRSNPSRQASNPSRQASTLIEVLLSPATYTHDIDVMKLEGDLIERCQTDPLDKAFTALKSIIRKSGSEHLTWGQGLALYHLFSDAGHTYQAQIGIRNAVAALRRSVAVTLGFQSEQGKFTVEQDATIDLNMRPAVDRALEADTPLRKWVFYAMREDIARNKGYSQPRTLEQKIEIENLLEALILEGLAIRKTYYDNAMEDGYVHTRIYGDLINNHKRMVRSVAAMLGGTLSEDLHRIGLICQFLKSVVLYNALDKSHVKAIKERNGTAMMIYPLLINHEVISKNLGPDPVDLDTIKATLGLAMEFLANYWDEITSQLPETSSAPSLAIDPAVFGPALPPPVLKGSSLV